MQRRHGGLASSDPPTRSVAPGGEVDPGLMARAFGLLFLAGPALGAAWLVLPGDTGSPPSPAFPFALLLTAAFGLALLGAGRRLPASWCSGVMAVATVAVTVAFYLTGNPAADTELLYLWATPYAFWFLPRHHAWAHTTLAAAGCAAALVALAPDRSLETLINKDFLGRWLATVTTLVVVGLLVRWLARSLQSSAEEVARRASAQVALADLGHRALAGTDIPTLFDAAVGLVHEALPVTHAGLLAWDGAPGAPRLAARRGWGPGEGRHVERLLRPGAGARAWTEDGTTYERVLDGSSAPSRHASAPVILPSGEFGVLVAWSSVPRQFEAHDLSLVNAVGNVLSTALARSETETRIRHAAQHDALTGLTNRALFRDRLEAAVDGARRTGSLVGVLIIDLDRFKAVNDHGGHEAGDILLQEVAGRLATSSRPQDTVARLGGDEFAVLVTDVPDAGAPEHVAARLAAALSDPFVVAGTEFAVGVSVGVAVHGRDGDGPDELLRNADAAMYTAKRGGGGVTRYDAARDDTAARRMLVEELREAIAEGQLRLYYQPSVRLHDGSVTGAEALVRWQHPERGVLTPDHFIPLAEESGLITPLTAWVVNEAAAQCRRWLDHGHDLCIAVNLSPRCVVDPSLPGLVRTVLEKYLLSHERVCFEVTETSLISRPDAARQVLQELSDIGVNIAVDDFGTGYATLTWLHQLPFHALKIDRMFVSDVTSGGPGTELVRYTNQLAHAMGKVTVAEGIECPDQWAALQQMGCDHAQGYAISRPLPADEFVAWLGTWPLTHARLQSHVRNGDPARGGTVPKEHPALVG